MLTSLFLKLRNNKLTFKEYKLFERHSRRLVASICDRLKIRIDNPVDLEIFQDNVYYKALLKCLDQFNSDRGINFSTFFYYKVLSAAECELGKYKRRNKIHTLPLLKS